MTVQVVLLIAFFILFEIPVLLMFVKSVKEWHRRADIINEYADVLKIREKENERVKNANKKR